MTWTHGASLILAAAGILAVALVTAATRDVPAAMRAGLELWTAAGLLMLTAGAEWRTLLGAAAVLAVRRIASAGLKPAPPRA